MAYFLKQSTYSKGLYLQIYESYHDKKTKTSRHRCYKSLGYVNNLITDKISDPVSYYKEEVKKLNANKNKEKELMKIQKIGEDPTRNFGYFIVKDLVNTLDLAKELEPFKYIADFTYPISTLLEALTYSRIVNPCSKLKTFNEVIPYLYESYDLSLDQIYDGLNFIGSEYSKFIEVLNYCIEKKFGRKTSKTYFDCTNYYFEIDFESGDRQKGPSKENRASPIIGQALLLDENGIPLCMRMYPGNESEKPKIREVIKEMREQNNIKGKTIQVADKGLNCGDNIYDALLHKDGYIFSQSVLQLEEKEKNWVLLDNDYEEVKDNNGNLLYKIKACVDEFPIRVTDNNGKKVTINVRQKRVATFNASLAAKKRIEINKLVEKAKGLCCSKAKKEEYGESSKYVRFVDDDGKNASVVINQDKIDKDLKYAGYNLITSSEINMSKHEIYRVYHNLWKIEDTFRILKSQLDARPVYLQKRESIYGHFLICYYAITLIRLLEEKIYKNTFSAYEIIDLIRGFKLYKGDDKNINLTKKTNNVTKLCELFGFNADYMYLSSSQTKKLFNKKYRIKNS
ncbi:MAG: IS1634 family transposase [Candidatus Onthovivens sp.]|nr:IS1634 family transposase [Candidatus Onthovivens sp.]